MSELTVHGSLLRQGTGMLLLGLYTERLEREWRGLPVFATRLVRVEATLGWCGSIVQPGLSVREMEWIRLSEKRRQKETGGSIARA
jgi:hypothetical protein